MEIHFPHLTNAIRTTSNRRRFNTPRRVLTATVAIVLCSAVLVLGACNVGGGGY